MVKSSNQSENQETEVVNVPMTLTLRDVVFIIAAVISMAAAWGMFGTRLSVVEEKVISIGDNLTQIRQIVKDLKGDELLIHGQIHDELSDLEIRLREIETQQAQLTGLIKAKKE